MQQHVLKIENLGKKYNSRWVVKSISLELKSGEIVGLLGPNGAGKTTAFYMIVNLVKPNRGKIFLDGKDISHMAIHQRARNGISYLPQEASVFRKMTVADNIMAILELNPALTLQQRKAEQEKLLHDFNITHIRNNLGISLSGGERRRTEIARALATSPKFMLLDEPFAGIDPISFIDIKKIMLQLAAKGIGVLITDHNVRETLDICNRAYVVGEGEIIAQGNPEEVLANEKVRKVYLGEGFKML